MSNMRQIGANHAMKNFAGHQPDFPFEPMRGAEPLPPGVDVHAGQCSQCGRRGVVTRARMIAVLLINGEPASDLEDMTLAPCGSCFAELLGGAAVSGQALIYVTVGGGLHMARLENSVDTVQVGTMLVRVAALELGRMVEDDPNKDTERATVFLDDGTRGRTVALGRAIHTLAGVDGMLSVHAAIAETYGSLARHLEMAWDGIGEWRA